AVGQPRPVLRTHRLDRARIGPWPPPRFAADAPLRQRDRAPGLGRGRHRPGRARLRPAASAWAGRPSRGPPDAGLAPPPGPAGGLPGALWRLSPDHAVAAL